MFDAIADDFGWVAKERYIGRSGAGHLVHPKLAGQRSPHRSPRHHLRLTVPLTSLLTPCPELLPGHGRSFSPGDARWPGAKVLAALHGRPAVPGTAGQIRDLACCPARRTIDPDAAAGCALLPCARGCRGTFGSARRSPVRAAVNISIVGQMAPLAYCADGVRHSVPLLVNCCPGAPSCRPEKQGEIQGPGLVTYDPGGGLSHGRRWAGRRQGRGEQEAGPRQVRGDSERG